MLERFRLPGKDSRLLRCKDKLYKVKLQYSKGPSLQHQDNDLPCSGDTMHKEIELAIRAVLSAAQSDISLEKLKTQHFGILLTRRPWGLGERMVFKQHGKVLKPHPYVLTMNLHPKVLPEEAEAGKSMKVVKKGVELVSPEEVEDDLEGLHLSELDVEFENDGEMQESEVEDATQNELPAATHPGSESMEAYEHSSHAEENTPDDHDINDVDDDISDIQLDLPKENNPENDSSEPVAKKIRLSPGKKLKVKVNQSPVRNGPGRYTHARRSVRVHVHENNISDSVDPTVAPDDEQDEDDAIPDLVNTENEPGESRNEGTQESPDLSPTEETPPPSMKNLKTRIDVMSLPKLSVNLGPRVKVHQTVKQRQSEPMREKPGPKRKAPPKPRAKPKSKLGAKKLQSTAEEEDFLEGMKLHQLAQPTALPTTPKKSEQSGSPLKKRVTPSRMGILQSGLDIVIKPSRHIFLPTKKQ